MEAKLKLRDLINLSNYECNTEKQNYMLFFREYENILYNTLDTYTINDIIEIIKREIPIPFNTSIKDDIMLNEKQTIFKKIYLNLNNELIKRNEIKDNNQIVDNIETKIKIMFLHLLKKHIESSNIEDTNYINILITIINKINYIYDKKNYKRIKYDINIEKKYLEKQIYDVIKIISKYDNDDLDDENIYAYLIVYQTLLRSLFIIIDDEKILEYYKSYVENNIKENTQAKNIILTAITCNKHDKLELEKIRRYSYGTK